MPSLMVPPRVFLPSGYPISTATTATVTGASFALPIADSYTAIVDVATVTGTTPTLDIAFQHSPDGGTSWYTFAKFAQITAAATRSLIFTPQVAMNQAASEQAIANTGAAVTINSPVIYTNVRVLSTVGGTTPSFGTIKLWVICAANGSSLLS